MKYRKKENTIKNIAFDIVGENEGIMSQVKEM